MKRGDLVLLNYPYTNGSGSKVRPALIVQNDRDNQLLTNTIVALITKNVSRVQEPTQFLIDLATPDGRQSGLNQNSANWPIRRRFVIAPAEKIDPADRIPTSQRPRHSAWTFYDSIRA